MNVIIIYRVKIITKVKGSINGKTNFGKYN